MRQIKVTFEDGNTLWTSINGTEAEIREYYEGKEFNLGDGMGGDRMVKAERVEFLDTTVVPLTKEQMDRLQAKVRSVFGGGK